QVVEPDSVTADKDRPPIPRALMPLPQHRQAHAATGGRQSPHVAPPTVRERVSVPRVVNAVVGDCRVVDRAETGPRPLNILGRRLKRQLSLHRVWLLGVATTVRVVLQLVGHMVPAVARLIPNIASLALVAALIVAENQTRIRSLVQRVGKVG